MAVYVFLIVGDTTYDCVILFFHRERKYAGGIERGTCEVHQELQS
jgi:hypothetical protein